ncbi:hypothetical protein DH2020_012408 [Rehmannia glutinosa]|uniref:Acyltransferase-like protein n=1 Tax=Rehmannia glutinosa TaxID=99300 RepID=A0ABR0X010_REHGL
MAAIVGNCLLATVVPRRSKTANRQLGYWPAHSIPSSVALQVIKRSRLIEIKSSLISSKNYNLEHDGSKDLIKSGDGEPPRWFTPLESENRLTGSPLLLFLPENELRHGSTRRGREEKQRAPIHRGGLKGLLRKWWKSTWVSGFVLVGLVYWWLELNQLTSDVALMVLDMVLSCTIKDLEKLVKMVESAIMSEHERAPKRPIYLVGESFGASLALVVAAQNPDIDLVLILANPTTSFSKSLLQNIGILSDMIHKHLLAGLPHAMSLIPVETILWKLKMTHDMQNYLDSHLHAVKAQTLVLSSGKDMLLSSLTKGGKLHNMLQRCEVRSFIGNGDSLFLDDTFDLVAAIKRTNSYRCGASYDYISDFLPPTPSEFKAVYEPFRWMDVAFNPVMLSTMDDGKIVRGLTGIPSEGPVLLVGNHMMLALESILLLPRFLIDQDILVRVTAHPLFFQRLKDGMLPDLSLFDIVRVLGGLPGAYARHFITRFGATIIPFGGVGEDDVLELLLDCDDQMKIPALKDLIEGLNNETVRLRTDVDGEVGKQSIYYPILLPKLPGRAYFLFGKPIPTKGREDILRNKDKAREMYIEVQNEIEKCIAFLKEKREKDPYRNLLDRVAYQGSNGFHSEVPTFDI